MGTELVPYIIDGDGHIFEHDSEIIPYLTDKYAEDGLRNYYLFPTLDGWRRGATGRSLGFDAAGWGKFFKYSNIDAAVLYPTAGLGFGFAKDPVWAADLAHAYNLWLSDHYLKKNSEVRGIAMLAVQDPEAAAKELEFAVKELGMVGGLLPVPGLRHPYGDPSFDPLYKVAESLGTMLGVHGASRQHGVGINLDYLSGRGMSASEGFVLAHLFGQMSQFTDMIYNQVWEKFPNLKVCFLEAGCGWVPYLMERIDRRSDGLATKQVKNSPIYFHAELEETFVLAPALEFVGEERFVYASDYPHVSEEDAATVLAAFLARTDLAPTTKQRILCDNIKEMYSLK